AGQEVARYFFQAGAAAGTIAKTMSAYDKTYSDKIYGVEETGRYVCESRVYKMLDHEYGLLVERLQKTKEGTNFFAFADTISAINFHRTNKGHGWLGMRFQLTPEGESNDVVIHVKMKDKSNSLQSQAVGILGVNLVYACFNYAQDPEKFIISLADNLEERIEVDMIRMTGPDLDHIDNRLLCLWLVKHGLTDVAMFNHHGQPVHASEFLYKKFVLVVRGSYRPATLVNMDMLKTSKAAFLELKDVEKNNTEVLAEITLDNLKQEGVLDEQDFLDRAEVLCALKQTTIVSNCEAHQKLIQYLGDYRINKLVMVMGVRVLLETINEKYYQNLHGNLLSEFGDLFPRNVKVFVYPSLQEGSAELMTARNVPVPNGLTFLYKHLLDNGQLEDLAGFNPDILHIYSKEVLRQLRADQDGWEKMVPTLIVNLIKEKCLFGFPCERLEFEY
ncbi:MAG: TonB-dependent receptor, partial [Bacteroidota bacterium]